MNNQGTFTKSGSAATSTISTTFNNSGTVNVQSGTLHVSNAATGTGAYTIGTASNGATLEFDSSVAAGATVMFQGSSGTLLILQPSSFSTSNVISGISGAGDVLDLRGFASGSDTITATTGVGSFNGTDTTLTVKDTTTGHTATFFLTLAGDYSPSTWTVTSDGHGGFALADPPATANATVASGTSLDIGTSSHATVTFAGGTGSLVLEQPQNFTGHIDGFTGTAPDAAHSDTIDLAGIDYNSGHFAESYNSSTGYLSVTDGSHTANFTFDNFNATLDFASDGNGGTLITDPPASGTLGQKTAPVSLHSSNDGFVFHPTPAAENNTGPDAHGEANAFADHHETRLPQPLAELIGQNPHSEAAFEFIHNEILAQTGMTVAQMHQIVQASHALLH